MLQYQIQQFDAPLEIMEPQKMISLDDYHLESIQRISEKIRQHTLIIFEEQKLHEFFPLASGVLLKWKEGYFLVLAGHTKTTTIGNNQLYTIFENDFIAILGRRINNKRGKGIAVDDDKIDCSIIKLTDSCKGEIIEKGYKFFNLGDVNIDHDDLPGMKYLVFGFPITKVKQKYCSPLDYSAQALSYQTIILNNNKLFKQLKLIEGVNFMVPYKIKKIFKTGNRKRVRGPEPTGLSGCGLWCLPNNMDIENNFYSLAYYPVGILTEHDKKNSLFIGTRLAIIANGIWQKFDPTAPRSRKLVLR
ncbi:MAG: hypothetical protein WKF87_04885 [Chryseolinea sp.]